MNIYKNKTRSVDVGSILVYCEMRRFKVRKVSRCAHRTMCKDCHAGGYMFQLEELQPIVPGDNVAGSMYYDICMSGKNWRSEDEHV